MGVGVVDNDKGWRELREIAGRQSSIKVGSLAKNSSGKPYAGYVEEGTPKMAGRHFMARWLEEHGNYEADIQQAIEAVISGTDSWEEMLNVLADTMNDDLRKTIDQMGLVRSHRLHDKVYAEPKP